MPCIPVPLPPLPTIPSPFSLTLPLPVPPDVQADVCCQAVNLGVPQIPVPLPPLLLNPAAVLVMREGAKVVSDYLRSLPIDCPRN